MLTRSARLALAALLSKIWTVNFRCRINDFYVLSGIPFASTFI